MSLLLAAFIACGSAAEPATPNKLERICVANVFHAVNTTERECKATARGEAMAAENRLMKGGFTKTGSTSMCVPLGSDKVSEKSLTAFMRDNMGANKTVVQNFDFKNGEFILRKKAPK